MPVTRRHFPCGQCFKDIRANNSFYYKRVRGGALVAVCEKCREETK